VLYPSIVTVLVLESVFLIIKHAAFATAVGNVTVTAPDAAFMSFTLMPSVSVKVIFEDAVLDVNAKLLASSI